MIDYNTNLYRLGIGLELKAKLELVHMENEPNELKPSFFFKIKPSMSLILNSFKSSTLARTRS